MIKASFKSTALAVMGIAALAIAVPMGIANAQDPGQRDQRTDQRLQRAGQLGQAPGGMQGMMGRTGGGGGTAMTQDQAFLYIVQGNQVFKMNKRDLSVVASGRLPAGQGGRAGFGAGEPGQRRLRGGGDGSRRTPPPPTE